MVISREEAIKYAEDADEKYYRKLKKERERIIRKAVSLIERKLDKEIRKGESGWIEVELPIREYLEYFDDKKVEEILTEKYSKHGWRHLEVLCRQSNEYSTWGAIRKIGINPARVVLRNH